MTNSIRKNFAPVIAFIMALIMAFGTTPAFATEIGDTVKWYRYFDDENYSEYIITDIINVNDTVIHEASSTRQEFCYILNVEETGYYAVNNKGDSNCSFPMTFENGVAQGEIDSIRNAFYLEEGKTLLKTTLSQNESCNISLEFIGKEITSVVYEQEYLENLIIGCEVAEDDTYFQMQHFSTVDITFSSGITFNDVYTDRLFRYDAPLKEGKNTGVLVLPGHNEPITFTAYPVSKYIESMEITNIEKVLDVRTNYRNEYVYPAVYKETVTVNFTDGTSIEVQPSPDINVGMDFINGHHYNLITHYDKTDDGIVFELGFGKHLFHEGTPILYSAPCKVSELSFSENLKVLSEMISWEYGWVITNSNVGTIFNINFRELYYALKHTADHISEFIDYYI